MPIGGLGGYYRKPMALSSGLIFGVETPYEPENAGIAPFLAAEPSLFSPARALVS
jgi:hypothetical protein